MKKFYTVTQIANKDSSDLVFGILLNKEHRIYEGHFPQQPVVPGVCMTLMIRELAEEAVGSNFMFSEISNIKFLAIVNPMVNTELLIKLKVDLLETGSYSVKASVEFADRIFLTLKGKLSTIKTSSDIDFSMIDKFEPEA
jgi:3-hydroxyacyl-[acyl-carrier-protein] dehydratase